MRIVSGEILKPAGVKEHGAYEEKRRRTREAHEVPLSCSEHSGPRRATETKAAKQRMGVGLIHSTRRQGEPATSQGRLMSIDKGKG